MQSGAIITCLLLSAVTAGGHYVVLIPSELRTDCVERVCVLLLASVQSSHLTLTIENEMTNSTIFQKEIVASTGSNCFNFTIGKDKMRDQYIRVLSVSLRGSGENLNISERKKVVLRSYNSLTFIQTDKPIYKAGQFVKFRIVTLDERFIPVQEKYSQVTVRDPKDNRIGQWNDVIPRKGIVDLTYELMPEPMKGTYRIEVLTKDGKVETEFTVKEYVLPKVEIIVSMPETILMTDPVIHVKVCGRYSYGKPVKGTVNGTVCLTSFYYFANARHCEDVIGETDADGCLVSDVPTAPYKLVQRRFTQSLFGFFRLEEEGTAFHLYASGQTKVSAEITSITFEEVEDYYKKGLPFTGQVRIQYSTGAPVRNASIYLFCSMVPGPRLLVTDENGWAFFSMDTSHWGSEPVTLTAIYQGGHLFQTDLPHHNSASHLVKPFYSRSGSFLSIQDHRRPQELACGSRLDVKVQYTVNCPRLQEEASLNVFYLVMSRGIIRTFDQKTITISSAKGSSGYFSLSIRVDVDISPIARLLVFAVLPDGEMIGDTANFDIQKCFPNKVSLHFSVAEDLPSSRVSLDVNAAPESLCGLRVVDRSVLLLKPEKELSGSSVYSMLPVTDLSEYHYQVQEIDEDFCSGHDPRMVPLSSSDQIGDVAHLLQGMGLKILSDTDYRKQVECEATEIIPAHPFPGYSFREYGPPGRFGEPMVLHSMASAPIPINLPQRPSVVNPVRKYFPETWVWKLVPVSSSGSASLTLTVPDSITEWKGSVFCTGQAGFGISQTVSLNAFKPFFVDLVLPFSIVRTEGFTLKAKIFNYLKDCIMVKVSLSEATGFKLASDTTLEHRTCVCSMDSVTVSWKLIATGLGEQNLTVSAESIASDTLCGNDVVIVPDKGALDTIRKPLLIKAEGIETELTRSSFLCPAGSSINEHIHLQLPEDVVPGSERAYITVLGDIMSSAMENLDGLLRLPTGCGEQNMVKFAPNVFVQRYLNKTHQLTPQIRDKAVGFLRAGYQNQLKYKHSDGSFSAFGSHDSEGNTWLTAFVLKSFLQARPYTFIDEKIISDATTFFLTHRMESGCFASLGRLFNNAMKGGADDSISLSAYVTTALLELGNNYPTLADEIFQTWFKSNSPHVSSSSHHEAAVEKNQVPDFKTIVTDRGLSCLREALETVNNTYTLSLLAYTFTLAQDQLTRNSILHRLEELAVKEGDLTHWSREQMPEEEHGYWWRAPSAEVEMTAYVLLAILSQPQVPTSELDQAIPIVRWLVKQRNSYGGFSSTQDTVVALHALSLYAELTHIDDPHSAVSVRSESGYQYEFHTDSTNQLLLQSQTLPEVPGEYTVTVTGTSCLLIQTSLRYNRPGRQKEAEFTLTVQMKKKELPVNMESLQANYIITTNITYVGDRPLTNMVLVDIAMLSGFSVLKDSYQGSLHRANISRSEINEGHLILYLEPMESHQMLQFSILVFQEILVENRKPAAVKVYDYYETDDSVIVEYDAPEDPGSV